MVADGYLFANNDGYAPGWSPVAAGLERRVRGARTASTSLALACCALETSYHGLVTALVLRFVHSTNTIHCTEAHSWFNR